MGAVLLGLLVVVFLALLPLLCSCTASSFLSVFVCSHVVICHFSPCPFFLPAVAVAGAAMVAAVVFAVAATAAVVIVELTHAGTNQST
jgi:hypothetical protein